MPRSLLLVAAGALTVLLAGPAAAPALPGPSAAATATAAGPAARALKVLRLGPAAGRVVVKVRCVRAAPLTGLYTVADPASGRRLATGGFACDGVGDQYAYATVVGSETENPPGSGKTSKAVAGAERLRVTLRATDARGAAVALGAARTLPVSGWLLRTDIAGLGATRARSEGASASNRAPVLQVSAAPASLERCAWKLVPRGGADNAVSTDPDGDAVTLTWYADGKRLLSGPLSTRGGTRLAVFRHTFPKLGVHRVRVVADDGRGARTEQTARLTCVSSEG